MYLVSAYSSAKHQSRDFFFPSIILAVPSLKFSIFFGQPVLFFSHIAASLLRDQRLRRKIVNFDIFGMAISFVKCKYYIIKKYINK